MAAPPPRLDLALPRALIWIGIGLMLPIAFIVLYINTAGDYSDEAEARAHDALAIERFQGLVLILLANIVPSVIATLGRWGVWFALVLLAAVSTIVIGVASDYQWIDPPRAVPILLTFLFPGVIFLVAGAALGLRRIGNQPS